MHVLEFGQIRSNNAKKQLNREDSAYILSKVWALHERMVLASKKMKTNISLRKFISNDKQWKIDLEEVF
jgi:Leu/Phe-tRNA-protein transferase